MPLTARKAGRGARISRPRKLANGEPAPIPPYPDFASHHWELGAGYGVYNRQNLVTAYVDYAITESIDAEGGHAAGPRHPR